jgi:hypothetical protein
VIAAAPTGGDRGAHAQTKVGAAEAWRPWAQLIVATAQLTPDGKGPVRVTTGALRRVIANATPATIAAIPQYWKAHAGSTGHPGLDLLEPVSGRPRYVWQVPNPAAATAAFPTAALPDGFIVYRHHGATVLDYAENPDLPVDAVRVAGNSPPATAGTEPNSAVLKWPTMAFRSATEPHPGPGTLSRFDTGNDVEGLVTADDLDPARIDELVAAHFASLERLQRDTERHEVMVRSILDRLAGACSAQVGQAGNDLVPDVRWNCCLGPVVAEVKTCGTTAVAGQLRLGLGQVLEYRATLAAQLRVDPSEVRAVLAVDVIPPGHWYQVCAPAGVDLLGPHDPMGDLASPP